MQKQSLKCADARHLIHLAVGDDTQADEERQVVEHLHICSDCRSYHAGLVDVMHAIERVRDEDTVDAQTGSIWPAIASQLKSRRSTSSTPERRRFNGAVAALCVCSLTLAMVTAVQQLPTNDVDSSGDYSMIPAMNVSYQNGADVANAAVQGSSGSQQIRLVQVSGSDGRAYLVDPATNQVYVPNAIRQVSHTQDLSF